MKKIIILAVGLVFVLCGCNTADTLAQGISKKSISGSGTVSYGRIGLDATTQTPELTSLFVMGDYASVAGGDEIFRYEVTEDASIFNSNSKTYKKKVFFASGDQARMDSVMQEIIAADSAAGSSSGNNNGRQ